ncbi:MAG TPA: hypothetical protein VGP38_02030, partial [Rubrobacter sp.]|nr:hypothetical protein [Rubrobacter sp.]
MDVSTLPYDSTDQQTAGHEQRASVKREYRHGAAGDTTRRRQLSPASRRGGRRRCGLGGGSRRGLRAG